MARQAYYSYHDCVTRMVNWCGGASEGRLVGIVRACVLDAYRDVANARDWSYYHERGRITTDASYSTGTITYDHTGGASERLVTLASGTWPTNAAYGILLISGVEYRVATREDSTTITLDSTFNPGADVAAGTSYTWYRDTYALPRDIRAFDEFYEATYGLHPYLTDATSILTSKRTSSSPGQPRSYALFKDPDNLATTGIQFDPPPDAAYVFDYYGMRVPNPLQTLDYSTGTVAISGTTVTGTSTAFTSAMVGSIFRVTSGTDVPTGIEGSNPFAEEAIIKTYTSATVIVLASTPTGSYTTKKYRISDPVDIEPGAMLSAFLACCKKNIGWETRREDAGTLESYYKVQMQRAADADQRHVGAVRTQKNLPWYRYGRVGSDVE